MGAFLLLFHITELYILKNKYLKEEDYKIIAEYKAIIFLYWIFPVWFISIIIIEATTSF